MTPKTAQRHQRNGNAPAKLIAAMAVFTSLGGCIGSGSSGDTRPDAGIAGAVDAGATCTPTDYTRRCRPDCYENPFGVFDCEDEIDAGPGDPCEESLAFWSAGDAGVCPEATDEVCSAYERQHHVVIEEVASHHDLCEVDGDCVKLSLGYYCEATMTSFGSCGTAVAANEKCAFHAELEERLAVGVARRDLLGVGGPAKGGQIGGSGHVGVHPPRARGRGQSNPRAMSPPGSPGGTAGRRGHGSAPKSAAGPGRVAAPATGVRIEPAWRYPARGR